MNDSVARLPRQHTMESHATEASQPQNLAPQTKWKRYEKFKPDNRIQQRVKRREIQEAAFIIIGGREHFELLRFSNEKCYPIIKTSPHYHNTNHRMGAIKSIIVELLLLLICCLLTIVPISQAFNSFNNQVNSFHHHHQNNNTPQNHHQIYQRFLNGPQNLIPTQPLPQVELPSAGGGRYGGLPQTMLGLPIVGGHHRHQLIQTPPLPPGQHPTNQLIHQAAGLYPVIGSQLPMQLAQINQVAHRRNEIQQQQQQPQQQLVNPYQAYQLQPVRPAKLMAEYVANQGQRILKNLVNTTIADLVNQSTIMKMNANKNLMMNTNQPATPANLLAGVVPFPKMNKLYTLLFPTPSPPVVFVPATSQSNANKQQQHQQQQHQTNNANNQTNHQDQEATDNNANIDSTQSSSSISHQEAGSSVGSSSADATADMYLNESQGREEKQQQQQILSLNAPYESQPRPSTLMGNRSPRNQHYQQQSRLNGLQTQMDPGLSMESINGDEWRRPDNDEVTNSLSQQEAQGFFENHHQQQQQQQQQFDSDDLNDNTNGLSSFRNNKAEMDSDSLGSYESAELIVPRHIHGGHSAMSQRNADTDTRKPIIIHDSELYSRHHHHHDNNDDQTATGLNQTSGQLEHDDLRGAGNAGRQFSSAIESEFSLSSPVMRHVRGGHLNKLELMERNQYEQPEDLSSNQSSSLSQDEVSMGNDMNQAQESIESMGGGGDITEGAELSIQMPQRGKSQRKPKRFQHQKQQHYHHHHHRHKHVREQQPMMEMQTLNQVELGEEQDLAGNGQRQSVNETRLGGSGEIVDNRFQHQQESISVHGGYANEEPSSTSEQPSLKISGLSNLLNGSSSGGANQQADDSYFTAHLPSQYEAVMRLPPEGYYDDYFKPPNSQSSLIHNSPSTMSLPSSQESDSNSAAVPEFGPSSTQSNSNNNNNNLIEGAVQYESVMEAGNLTSGVGSSGDGYSGRSKKHWVPPSYHSQIIATDNGQQFDGNNSSYVQQQQQPTTGHTKQYHANQQQAPPATNSRSSPPVDNNNNNNNSNDAARIEFVTPVGSVGNGGDGNRTTVSEERGNLESLNYEIPSVYEKTSPSNNNQQQMLQANNVTLEPIPMNEQRVAAINNTHRYQTLITPKGNPAPSAINTSQQQQQQQQLISSNEDSIKLIIANTISDSRDPQSNEKLINYTSEGYNITRGKSPRNNFINKDMNEFPPADQPATVVQQNQLLEQQDGQRGMMLHPNALSQQQQPTSADIVEGAKHTTSGHHFQVLLPQFPRLPHTPAAAAAAVTIGASNQQRPPTSNEVYQPQQQVVAAGSDEQQVAQGGEEESEDDQQQQYKTVQRIVEPADGKHLAMDLRDNNNQRPHVEIHHEQHHQNHHNDHVEQQQRQPSSPSEQNQLSTEGDRATNRDDAEEKDAAEHHQPKIRNRKQLAGQRASDSLLREDRKRERRARQRGRFSKQQTIARPQITQVSFSPKDLAMNPPKALPTTSDGSPLEAIAEIPRKVEQLRENQPDKNELMNELLTALDRVKVAIYKLQPLTAKMNAIYRKSVTSNTRDIIMDNHKGTYAKRYPPGDYDDTYDRMHPSELLSRQPAASQRSSATAGSSNTKQPEVEANESVENAVYLPAPKEILEKHKRDSSLSEDFQKQQQQHQVLVANVELDSLNALESKIIATGIGRRLGDGRVMGRLSLDSGERLVYDDEDFEEASSTSNATTASINRPLPSFFPPLNQSAIAGEGDIQEPLFGYRITIYRSPEATEAEADSGDGSGQGKSSDHLRYQVDQGDDDGDDDAPGNEDDDTEPTSAASDSTSGSGTGPDAAEDLIATSESSLVDSIQQPMASEELGPSISIADPLSPQPHDKPKVGDLMDESESKGKKVEEKSDKKKKMMMMMKKKKKSHMHKRKKNEEESKKKKEYRKIKHEKGIISKERKTMKRDKHIKAHDRGAAKEKALKERTQIEFFEREQIVDDEFEKGKKSTVKGGWQSGQDSKKSIRDTSGGSGGDTMSSGGSHYVEHEMPKEISGGHKVSSEASSAKKSNKFEKKEMEAKGKKFKGWREKGYKIITETEFIDRGSLHDSAYKKRDKGAAHHQKFKKQEASSEGHHGTLLEHHKKSNKKEEKKSNEKKGEEMMKKKKKKEQQQKKMEMKKKEDHKHEESVISATSEPEDSDNGDDQGPQYQHHSDSKDPPTTVGRDEHRRGRGIQPMLMSATSSTFRPAIMMPQNSEDSVQTRTLIRLINSNVHDEQQQQHQPIKSYHIQPKGHMDNDRAHPSNQVSHLRTKNSSQQHSTIASEPNVPSRYHLLNDAPSLLNGDDSNRRSDMPSNPTTTMPPPLQPQSFNKHQRSSTSNSTSSSSSSSSYPVDSSVRSNSSSSSPSTILDIVDNLTGRQINKTKIGTYDLEDHHTIRLDSSGNNSTPLVKISNGLAKYFPFLATQAGQQPSNRNLSQRNPMIHDPSSTTTSSTTTRRPTQAKQSSYLNNINLNDLLNPIPNQRSDFNHNNFHSNNLMMINQNHDSKQATIMARQTNQVAARINDQQLKISPRPTMTTTTTTTTTTDNPGVIQFAAAGTQTTGAPPAGPFITPAQANVAAAAHLLQLVHRASQINQIQNPLANHQPGAGNLMDQLQPQVMQHPQLQSPINRVAPFIPSASSLATSPYQPGGPMFHPVAQMSFAPPPPPPDGPNFGGEQQFADYEHDSILRRPPFTS